MRIITILAAAAAALVSTVGIAQAPVEQRFTRDGRTYVYTSSARDDGRTLLVGREINTNARFRLLVNGDRVSGYSNGVPVRFRAETPLAPVAVAANN